MKKKELMTLMASEAEELRKEIVTVKKAIQIALVSKHTKSVKNVREVKKMRNKVAVMLTALRQKELQHG